MPREGEVGTWSHCGDRKPHGSHNHTIVMNEGPYPSVLCLGTDAPTNPKYPPTPPDHTEDLKYHLGRLDTYSDFKCEQFRDHPVPDAEQLRKNFEKEERLVKEAEPVERGARALDVAGLWDSEFWNAEYFGDTRSAAQRQQDYRDKLRTQACAVLDVAVEYEYGIKADSFGGPRYFGPYEKEFAQDLIESASELGLGGRCLVRRIKGTDWTEV